MTVQGMLIDSYSINSFEGTNHILIQLTLKKAAGGMQTLNFVLPPQFVANFAMTLIAIGSKAQGDLADKLGSEKTAIDAGVINPIEVGNGSVEVGATVDQNNKPDALFLGFPLAEHLPIRFRMSEKAAKELSANIDGCLEMIRAHKK